MRPPARTRRRGLDGLRAVAVVAVLLYHAQFEWAAGGWLGVDLFFVLSGFLITSLLVEEHALTGRISLTRFYARRALRLFPALAVVCGAVLAYGAMVYVTGADDRLRGDVWSGALYLQNWKLAAGDGPFLGFMAHAWSLAIEEQFYVLWPPLVVGVVAVTRRWWPVAVVAGIGAVVGPVLQAVLYDGPSSVARVYYGLDTRAGALLLGAAVGVAAGRGRMPAGRWSRRAAGVAFLGATAALTALVVSTPSSTPALYTGLLAAADACALLVVIHVVLSPTGVVARVLELRPLAALGRVSYGVYLWHWPVFLALTPDGLGLSPGPAFAVRAAATLGLSLASWFVVEKPVLRLKKRVEVGAAPAPDALPAPVAPRPAVSPVAA